MNSSGEKRMEEAHKPRYDQRLVRRFWSEFMEPANLNADTLAKCDPQEMALFAFLVGAGMSWDDARQAENLDILEANTGDNPTREASSG